MSKQHPAELSALMGGGSFVSEHLLEPQEPLWLWCASLGPWATRVAAQVYDAIEASNGFYSSPVEPSVRSNMNIPFTVPSDAALEKEFLQEASKKNMVRLAMAKPHYERQGVYAGTSLRAGIGYVGR